MEVTTNPKTLAEPNDTQNKEPKIFNPNGGNQPSIEKRWREARQLVESGNYEKASERFLSISRDPTVSGMEQVWTSLEASIANSLAGNPGVARRLISKSLSDFETLPEQHSKQQHYRELCLVLERIKPPTSNGIPEKPQNITVWMGTFAIALKLWEQGQMGGSPPLICQSSRSRTTQQPLLVYHLSKYS
jgi:hypothetical protein